MIKERLISALLGTLMILAFQPFGLYAFGAMRWLLMLGIVVCVFSSCILSEYILRYLFRMPNNIEAGMNYNIKRNFTYQVVNIVLLTASVSLFLDRFACNDQVDNHLSFKNVIIVFGVFVGASLMIGLYWKNVYWKRHYMHELADANRLNGILQERNRKQSLAVPAMEENNAPAVDDTSDIDASVAVPPQKEEKHEPILLEGSTKENVSVCPSDFLYAESDGNYVSVYYLKDGKQDRAFLRTSIKNIAQALCGRKGIIQCHRAFIVNLLYVEHVEGRSSGIGLKLKGVDDIIPVSKSYVSEVKRLIQNPE